jgi:hypothetical protein
MLGQPATAQPQCAVSGNQEPVTGRDAVVAPETDAHVRDDQVIDQHRFGHQYGKRPAASAAQPKTGQEEHTPRCVPNIVVKQRQVHAGDRHHQGERGENA